SRVLKNADKKLTATYSDAFVPGIKTAVNLACDLTPPISVGLPNGEVYELRQALITGALTKVCTERNVEMKALVRDGERWPYAACLLAELSDGHLFGVTIGQQSVNLITISLSLRNQQVLRRLRLRR